MNFQKINQEIQYLRAIAILLTLFHHIIYYLYPNPQNNQFIMNLYSHFTFWGGVDLFFCISGFVIMLSFSDFIQITKTDSYHSMKRITAFWCRRLIRLMPTALFWMTIYLCLTWTYNYLGAFGELKQNFQDMIAAVFQYANLHGLDCWGKGSNLTCGPNGIYWSLSLEEQFYFIFPIVAVIFRKKLVYVLSLLFLYQFFIVRPEWSIGWAFRFDAIILGVLIALFSKSEFYKYIEPKFLKSNKWLSLLIVLVCVFFIAYISAPQNKILLNVGILSLICGFLVWLASYQKKYLNFEIYPLDHIMSWFGSRSYSIYLTHVIAFRLSHELLHQFSGVAYKISEDSFPVLLFISSVLVLVFSEFSYKYIELPSKRYAVLLSNKLMYKW